MSAPLGRPRTESARVVGSSPVAYPTPRELDIAAVAGPSTLGRPASGPFHILGVGVGVGVGVYLEMHLVSSIEEHTRGCRELLFSLPRRSWCLV